MRKFGPFDTSVFYEVENRRLQRAFNPQTGFVKSGQGAVTAGTGAQLVIAAYPDGALIDGLYVENPASETVTLTTNTGSTNPRIDRLVMRLDMSAKTIAPFQIVGTPAASPQVPPLVQTANTFDMPLCQYTMPGNGSAQNPGSIVDERVVVASALLGKWTDLLGGTGYSFGLGASGATLIIPGPGGTDLLVPVPAGRQLEVEFDVPGVSFTTACTVFLQLNDNAGQIDGAEITMPAGAKVPVKLHGFSPGDGGSRAIWIQGWTTGQATVAGSGSAGAHVRLRYRIN